jgi:hypothetical protein
LRDKHFNRFYLCIPIYLYITKTIYFVIVMIQMI